MPPKADSGAVWNPFTAKSRAERSAEEMYPGKIGQDDQRDAARHMLASGYLAKAWGPGIADLIGKAHEFKETPFRHLGALAGMSQYRYDRPIDLHNNALGIELAQKARDLEEFERLVNAAAERARPTQTPGAPWVPAPKEAEAMRKGSAQYADGGAVTDDHTQPDMADGGRLIGDPNLYAGGGLVKKALGALADVLPRAQAEKNLDKFLAKSAVKQPVYHGTNIPEAIVESQQFAHPQPGKSGIHWFSESPKLADKYTSKYWEDYGDQGAIFPMHMQAMKPLELPFNMNDRASKEFKRYVREEMGVYPEVIADAAALNSDQKLTKVWHFVNSPEFREAAMRKGYDSLRAMEGKTPTWGAFNPEQVKSVFNRGTYDTKTPDIGKAGGGLVAAFKDGGSTDAAFGVFPQMKPRRAGKSNIGEELYKAAFIPQDMLDVALMAAPYGKLGKLAAAGAAALSPMEAEAGKVKTGLDLGRRALFGLKPSQEMAGRELVSKAEPTLDEMRAALNRAERAAPKVEERSVTIDPGKGSAKVTDVVQKVAETPVSRRTVLKSAAGQVMQHAMPAHSFADLMKPAEVIKEVAKTAAPAFTVATEAMIPGIVAEGIKMGYSFPRIMKMVEGELGTGLKNVGPEDIERTYQNLMDPYSAATGFERKVSPGEAWQALTGVENAFGTPTSRLRESMRSVKNADPELYESLRNIARDVSEYGFEP